MNWFLSAVQVCLSLLFTSESLLLVWFDSSEAVFVYLPFVVSAKVRPHCWRQGSWGFVKDLWLWQGCGGGMCPSVYELCLRVHQTCVWVWMWLHVWEVCVEKSRVCMRHWISFFFTQIACEWVYYAKPQFPDFLSPICVYLSSTPWIINYIRYYYTSLNHTTHYEAPQSFKTLFKYELSN